MVGENLNFENDYVDRLVRRKEVEDIGKGDEHTLEDTVIKEYQKKKN